MNKKYNYKVGEAEESQSRHACRGLKAVLGAAAVMFAGTFAYGDSITFNFNSLNPGNTNAAITTYIDNALHASSCGATCNVTVNGGGGTVYAGQAYTGEGFVVGPNANPVTLGNTNGATGNNATPSSTPDTFLSNVYQDSNGTHSGGNDISLNFSGFTFSGTVSFDFEIFPDGTCPSLSNCGYDSTTHTYLNLPDFELQSGGAAVTSFGTSGFVYGVVPGSGDGNETGSPNDNGPHAWDQETAPQYIGVSGNLNLAGQHDLDFIDWPAAIGVDNLTINYTPPGGNNNNSSVPETSSVLLLGTVSGLLIPLFRRFRKA